MNQQINMGSVLPKVRTDSVFEDFERIERMAGQCRAGQGYKDVKGNIPV